MGRKAKNVGEVDVLNTDNKKAKKETATKRKYTKRVDGAKTTTPDTNMVTVRLPCDPRTAFELGRLSARMGLK